MNAFQGHVEIVRNGILETVVFPRPLALRLTESSASVRNAVHSLKHSPSISRESQAAKLRDFLLEADNVLNAILCEEQLYYLKNSDQQGTVHN